MRWLCAALLSATLAGAACEKEEPRVFRSRPEPAPSATQPQGRPAPAARTVASFRFSFGEALRPSGWPRTRGIAWQREPATALSRARKERKAVLVYVGSLGCPHCRRLEQELLSSSAFRAALARVIPLASYRFSNDDGDPSAMAVRVDVATYPRLRFIDGWGRMLLSPSHRTDAAALKAQIERAARAAKSARPPAGGAHAAPLAEARAAMKRLIEARELAAVTPYAAHHDAVVRLAALERTLALDLSLDKALGLVKGRLLDQNDHVRQAAYEALKRRAPKERAELIEEALRLIDKQAAPRPATSELRLTALEALTELAPVDALDVLAALPARVCGLEDGCCDQLARLAHALWRKHRDARVVALLRQILWHSAVKPRRHFSASDTQLALGVLGEVLQKELLPPKRDQKSLRAAARLAAKRTEDAPSAAAR